MKKIRWPIWAAVVVGWLAAAGQDGGHSGSVAWLLGVAVLVISYYAENRDK